MASQQRLAALRLWSALAVSALFAGNRPVADIATAVNAVPVNLVDGLVGRFCGGCDRVAQPHHAQYASAARDDVVAVEGGAGVENFLIGAVGSSRPLMSCPCRSCRIPAGREDHAECGTRVPLRSLLPPSVPSSVARQIPARLDFSRIMIGCVSGSPMRQLNSITFGVPSAMIIRPAYRKPRYG